VGEFEGDVGVRVWRHATWEHGTAHVDHSYAQLYYRFTVHSVDYRPSSIASLKLYTGCVSSAGACSCEFAIPLGLAASPETNSMSFRLMERSNFIYFFYSAEIKVKYLTRL
jgi:hypothetical protein